MSALSVTSHVVKILAETADLGRAKRKNVAGQLGMSDTTLGRRLREEGTNFQTLVDGERRWRLSGAPVKRGKVLFELLGFDELNSFYRWYKSAYGHNWTDRGGAHG